MRTSDAEKWRYDDTKFIRLATSTIISDKTGHHFLGVSNKEKTTCMKPPKFIKATTNGADRADAPAFEVW